MDGHKEGYYKEFEVEREFYLYTIGLQDEIGSHEGKTLRNSTSQYSTVKRDKSIR